MTISSYSLVLMVIHFLQYAVNPPVLPCLHEIFPDKFPLLRSNDFGYVDMNETIGPYDSKNIQTVGELFLYFLEYYSCFDYTQYAISVRTGGLLPISECRIAKSIKNDIHQWKELCIEEPFDLTNTARSVYDYETFERVKAVFVASWHILQETLDLNSVFSPIIIPTSRSTETNAIITTTTFSDIESNLVVVSKTKNNLEQYVNTKNFNLSKSAAENYKTNNNSSTEELEEEDSVIDVDGDGTDESEINITATSITQKFAKRKDLNRTLTPRSLKTYGEKEFSSTTVLQAQNLTISPSAPSSSLTCHKSTSKSFNRSKNNSNNNNKTTVPIITS